MVNLDDICTIDFETAAIQPRPAPAPVPVGLAIRWPGGKQVEYIAFGHPNPADNNATKDEAYNALIKAYRGPVLAHNLKFDCEVAWTHFGLRYPREVHDSLFACFLDCPHAPSFALKASAERVLKMPPAAQDLLHEWIIGHIPGATKKNAGAYIAQAPVSLVRPYAIDDVKMTFNLFAELYPRIVSGGMEAAYQREIKLWPWLLEAEVRGVPVDRYLLNEWDALFQRGIPIVDQQIRNRLGSPSLNLDEDRAVAEAIDRAGLVANWELTPSGQRATNKKAMLRQCSDTTLLNLLSLRNTAATMHRSFVEPWLQMSATDGRLHTAWNQTRSLDNTGTKTGRIGSERPNLANVPNPALTHPELPQLRRAFLPEEGHVWLKADYSQQEFRIAAHFEAGAIMQAYQQDPTIDFHALTANLVKMHSGLDLPRKIIKNVNFALLYGGGVRRLSEVCGVSQIEAKAIKDAYYAALPGMRQLSQQVQIKSAQTGSVRTIGGRLMPVEPPRVDPATQEVHDWLYKQLNKLCQGSAADMTKEAIIQFGSQGTPGQLLITVYDEIDVSVPQGHVGSVASGLESAMVNAIPIDVPVQVDLEIGDSWGELEPIT